MTRLALLAAVAGGLALVQAAPLVTLHALATHSAATPHDGASVWARDPGLALILALATAAALPALGLALAVSEWIRAAGGLRRIRSAGERRSCREIEYWRFPATTVTMFVAGTLRPRIYASTAAEMTLPPEAFLAALLHERAHRQRGDVVLRHVLHAFERSFGRLPGVRAAADTLRLRSECRADGEAVAAGADRRGLFDAIVVASSGSLGPAAPLSDGAVLPRLEVLAGSRQSLPGVGWKAPLAICLWLALPPVAAHVLVWGCTAWLGHL